MLPTDPNSQQPASNNQQTDDNSFADLPAVKPVVPTNQSIGDPVIQKAGRPNDPYSAKSPGSSLPQDPFDDNQNLPTRNTPPAPSGPDLTGISLQKERDLLQKQDEKYIEEIGKEIELEKELKESGVEKMGEEITLPEPVQKIVAESIPPTTSAPPAKGTTVPLTQAQIKKALHKRVTEAVLWLAIWCLKQLKIKKKSDN